jgi:hypothetical protein
MIDRRAFCPWRVGLRCHARSTFEKIVFGEYVFEKILSNMRLSYVAETAGCPNLSGNIIG